jgi:hypothetical protein
MCADVFNGIERATIPTLRGPRASETGRVYRSKAEAMRNEAGQAALPTTRETLLRLAANYDALALYFEKLQQSRK